MVMHMVAVGGSDAGISAALRAREVDPGTEVTVVAADAYPNFSICGIPYYVSGEVPHWRNLAHRTIADLEAAGMMLRLDTTARRIDVPGRKLLVTGPAGGEELIGYDKLVIGTGAVPVRPPIAGLDTLGPADGVHLLHSMGDTFALMRTLEDISPASAVIVGAGYIGLEMAEGLTTRGMEVTQIENCQRCCRPSTRPSAPWSTPSCPGRGVEVLTRTTVRAVARPRPGNPAGCGSRRSPPTASRSPGTPTWCWSSSGSGPTPSWPGRGRRRARRPRRDRRQPAMRTGLPDVYAAGDCVITHHRLLGQTYLPLGTTAHKQGRVAGENALGGNREFAGSLGTQVVKIFDAGRPHRPARRRAAAAGFAPATSPPAPTTTRRTTPAATDRHAGHRRHLHRQAARRPTRRRRGSEIAKRIDISATAIFHGMAVDALTDLDLSYTPPLGCPWDAVQIAAQTWIRHARQP